MNERGVDTSVVLHQEGPFADYLEARKIPYKVLGSDRFVGVRAGLLPTAVDLARVTPRLVHFIRDQTIDIVHGNDTRINLTWVAATRAARARYIWHQRAVLTPQRTTRTLIRLAHRTICISEFVKERSDLGHSEVVHNPFQHLSEDRPSVREALLEELRARPTAKIVGFVGRLVSWKNPERLVESLPGIRTMTGKDVRACFFGVGSPQMTHRLEHMAREKDVEAAVHLLGFRDPIEPFIRACDVVVAPSTDEPFGRVLVEAAMSGTAVVASDSGAHPEIITNGVTGFLVDVNDLDAVTDRIVRLISDGALRERITETARADAEQRFSVQAHSDEITRIYETLGWDEHDPK